MSKTGRDNGVEKLLSDIKSLGDALDILAKAQLKREQKLAAVAIGAIRYFVKEVATGSQFFDGKFPILEIADALASPQVAAQAIRTIAEGPCELLRNFALSEILRTSFPE